MTASDGTLLWVTFYLEQDYAGTHPHFAEINIMSDGPTPMGREVILTVNCGTETEVHGWSNVFVFSASEFAPGTVDGDSWYTVSGNGSNSDAVISVGSYATRINYTTYNGTVSSGFSNQLGDISEFSSKGPTTDGRVKPDITAPGEVIIAPFSRYTVDENTTVYDTIVWNGNVEYYGPMMGTSMSTPMVTGIVALWLQQNPSLGVDSVRHILHSTARNDYFTGNAAVEPSNIWGHGKINTFGGLPVETTLYLVTTIADDENLGQITGGGVVTVGTHTLTAIPKGTNFFVAWEDGCTDNPRTVDIFCDTVFTATFGINSDSVSIPSYDGTSCYTITTNRLQLNITNAEGCALHIYDITGRLVVSRANANGSYQMPSPGVYIVDVYGHKPKKIMMVR